VTQAGGVDVLVPTRDRPEALAVALAGLAGQVSTVSTGFRVLVSDQSDGPPAADHRTVQTIRRVLEHRGHPVEIGTHLPRRGLAEHRAHLLSRARARHVLFLDDDVWLDPHALGVLLAAIRRLRCGFVGMAPQGMSYYADRRPTEHEPYAEWRGGVRPERVRSGTPEWERWKLHNAANLVHLAEGLGLRSEEPECWRPYKVAWVGGCVLYDRAALRSCGGFDFWRRLPVEHAGEDVVAQLRVMQRYGGAGLLPSRAVHLELPTTVPNRGVNAYDLVMAEGESRSATG
jgi:GT2 family glycosyltransferase